MLRKHIYPHIENALNRAGLFLDARGFTPNQLTLAGLALNFITGVILASGWLFAGALMILAAGLADLLDGPMARASGKTSRFGAFLDSSIDRYSDFLIFGGLAVHFAQSGQSGYFLLCLGSLMGASLTSYVKARAENMVESCQTGILQRAERLILLTAGLILPFLLGIVLWILFLGTNATAVWRILYTGRALRDTENSSPPSS